MLIAVKGWDGFELWIEASLVMSVKRHVDSNTIKPKCLVNMKCEKASEEWMLTDDADRVRRAVDEANARIHAEPLGDSVRSDVGTSEKGA